jgi:PilZ domain
MMTANIELPGHFLSRGGFLRADRRTKQRNPTFKFGVMTFGPDRRLCVVKNISPTGAMIELENTLEIPDEFTLAIEADSFTHVCRVAWKASKQIAVNFDSSRRDLDVDRTDRRQAPRRIVNAAAWIRLDGGFATRECKIVDVSTTGVRLSLSFAAKIPATFMLLFSKHAQGHRVRTVWRRANEIGATFI